MFMNHHTECLSWMRWEKQKQRSEMILRSFPFMYWPHPHRLILNPHFCLSVSLRQNLCFNVTRPLEYEPVGPLWVRKDPTPPTPKKEKKKKLWTRCMMLYGQTGKHKRSKNKSHELTERLSTVCFENSPAESSDASPPSRSLPRSQHCPHLSFLPHTHSPYTTTPHLSYSPRHPPPETKCSKRKERTPFLLISWGLSRRRICCLSFSSAVHGLSTAMWSWACVAKSRRKDRAKQTQMPRWRSWTGLQWGLSLKWGPIISI